MEDSVSNNDNLLGAACYFLLFATGLLFLFVEKENKFIRFHAMQSTITFGILVFTSILLGMLPGGIFMSMFINLIILILWIILMIKAFGGEYFKLPYIGDIAEKQLAKIP